MPKIGDHVECLRCGKDTADGAVTCEACSPPPKSEAHNSSGLGWLVSLAGLVLAGYSFVQFLFTDTSSFRHVIGLFVGIGLAIWAPYRWLYAASPTAAIGLSVGLIAMSRRSARKREDERERPRD